MIYIIWFYLKAISKSYDNKEETVIENIAQVGDPIQLRHDNDIAGDSHDNIEIRSAMPTSHRVHLNNPRKLQNHAHIPNERHWNRQLHCHEAMPNAIRSKSFGFNDEPN